MSDLRHLSNRARSKNLAQLRPLGSWEREQLDREKGKGTKSVMPPPATPAAVNHTNKINTNKGEMVMAKSVEGNCSLCGKEGHVKMVAGRACCAPCLVITGSARNHPALMIKALVEIQGEEYLTGSVSSALWVEEKAGLMKEINRLSTQVEELEEKNARRRGISQELAAENERLREAAAPRRDLDFETGALSAEVERLQGENKRLFSVIEGIEEEKGRLRQQLEDGKADSSVDDAPDRQGSFTNDEDRQALNEELAAANTRLVKKLRDLDSETERLLSVIESLEEQNIRFKEYNKTQFNMLEAPAADKLALTGELEGLQDVLASMETERTVLATDKDRLTEEVRWLYERLGAYENKADEIDQEVDTHVAMVSSLEAANKEQRTELEILRHQLRENGATPDPYPSAGSLAAMQESFRATAEARRAWTAPAPDPAGILTETQEAIYAACDSLRSMLIDKNRAYGNSALEPLRVFSRASAQEQILVRIDDKLSRISRGSEFPGDDTIMDLAGYLVLLMVQRTQETGNSLEEAA